MIRGVDVSGSQGVLTPGHWELLARQGIAFAYLEASVGNDQIDDGVLERNIGGVTAAGIPFGTYHFAYPLPESDEHPFRDPISQMDLAYRRAQGRGTLRPVLDLEWPPPDTWAHWGCSKEQITDWILKAIDYVPTLWGCLPIIYGDRFFLSELGLPASVARCGLWIADWRQSEPPLYGPRLPDPWTDSVTWQWTGGKANVPNGAPGDFDLARDLAPLLKPTPGADPWLVGSL
jgi:GH25 family lysozyme M1 (1,4-beta-N-acetylmuramidase)